jgi:hypothetical protein
VSHSSASRASSTFARINRLMRAAVRNETAMPPG